MYEWESELTTIQIERRKGEISKEIKRISTTTLRGNFSNPEDRKYWENKLTTLNGQLIALETRYPSPYPGASNPTVWPSSQRPGCPKYRVR